MKLISWNVNGLRASMRKGFLDFFQEADADIFAVQEIGLAQGQINLDLEGYHCYWAYSDQDGYGGLGVFTRLRPKSLSLGLGSDYKSRLMTLDYGDFYLVNLQAPNSQRDLVGLDARLDWEARLRDYLASLIQEKKIIVAGDFNLAHRPIDLKNPRINKTSPGFTHQERQAFDQILDLGLVDSFRQLNPDQEGAYTWWSYMRGAKARNVGWRLDYFLVGSKVQIKDAWIYSDVDSSDHCPIGLLIK